MIISRSFAEEEVRGCGGEANNDEALDGGMFKNHDAEAVLAMSFCGGKVVLVMVES